jgi:precorrin-2 dehydrogenase / sirohydrochlorin ferrochelatase
MKNRRSSLLYPVFLRLHDKLCVICGGGAVACRKVKNLLPCGAIVKVISPTADQRMKTWALRGRLTWHETKFSARHLTGAHMVFAVTDDRTENARISALCRKKGIPVNIADDPAGCDFFVPSVLRRKSLAVAVSTAGMSPMFARTIRKELEQTLTGAYGEFLDLLGDQRGTIQRAITDSARRRKIFKRLVASDILDLLKAGRKKEAKHRIQQCISSSQG